VDARHFVSSLDALHSRPRDLAQRPVTQRAFLGAPENSITGRSRPGEVRLRPDGEDCCAATSAVRASTPPCAYRINRRTRTSAAKAPASA